MAATLRKPVEITGPDSSTFPDRISNQLSLTNANIGNIVAYVLKENASDTGVYVRWSVPKNYVSTPKLIVKGILDGAVGGTDVLAFTFQGIALATNEAVDAAWSTQDLGSTTIGGTGGTSHSDEDMFEQSITLTNLGTLTVDDTVFGQLFIDVSVNTYGGNFLLTSIEFEYNDT